MLMRSRCRVSGRQQKRRSSEPLQPGQDADRPHSACPDAGPIGRADQASKRRAVVPAGLGRSYPGGAIVTSADRQAWLALYAISWHQSSALYAGHVADALRARYAAEQANRGLQALRDLSVEVAEGRLDITNVVEIFE